MSIDFEVEKCSFNSQNSITFAINDIILSQLYPDMILILGFRVNVRVLEGEF